MEDALSLSDSLRLVSGMNYCYDRADSGTCFNGNFIEQGLSVDVKLFYDEINGMISEPLRNHQYFSAEMTF